MRSMRSIGPSMLDDMLQEDDGADGGAHPFAALPDHAREGRCIAVAGQHSVLGGIGGERLNTSELLAVVWRGTLRKLWPG